MTINSKLTATLAFSAALSMAATPVSAVELPVGSPQVTIPGVTQAAPAEDSAERHRHRRYRRDRVDAGDVIAGVLILGGIAAIASAASRDKRQRDADTRYRNRDYRDRDYRDRDYRYRDSRTDSRYDAGSGIDNAVNMCVREVERNVRIDTVDEVNRSGEGWRVAGRLYNGEGFNCRIGNNGRIENIDYGRSGVSYSDGEDNQWDDERYRSARAQTGYTGPDARSERQPSYPGGPVDGDTEGESDEDLTNGRYD